MSVRKLCMGAAAGVGMLILILDSQTAISGMREGIELCVQTLVPSLFPFFVLSILITGSLLGRPLRLLRPVGILCGIPGGGESLLAVGLLGGYPVGAQNVAMAYQEGCISKEDGERLLVFCNNAGPAFLFGIVGSAFDAPWVPWVIWGIHIASALMVGAATRPKTLPAPIRVREKEVSLTNALRSSLSIMAQVSGWVVIFRMVTAYLERWFLWLLPKEVQLLIVGALELSNGCVRLRAIQLPGLRFLCVSVLLALGGVCVSFQTGAAAGDLRLRAYFPGKLLQAVLSFFLAFAAQMFFPAACRYMPPPLLSAGMLLLGVTACLSLRKAEKRSSILTPIGV